MKFAYLIMAHDNPRQLSVLLSLLDVEENDIFLHIDKKSLIPDIYIFEEKVKNAKIRIYQKYNVQWGGMSQTKCQMFLLGEAIRTYHEYYHLLSGHDLPLKSNQEISAFFSKNNGKEFIHFESNSFCLKDNCRYYHIGNNFFSHVFLAVQKIMKVNRKLYCGANWYSITHALATEFCTNKKLMLRIVRWTRNSDEYILQTFYNKVAKGKYELYRNTDGPYDYSGCARLIDWSRGNPYVWRKDDFEELIESGRMFARKFDENIDEKIIEMVVNYINGECSKIKKLG